ncbi:MAG: HAD-IA family hydrolase [Lachnospiraceae bacterium]|nr:HAD-IA family hydrolase [Lachnospiraceae bacterium]
MDIRVVIFDFDGTLADTRAPIVTAKQETMKHAGLEVMDEEACASTIGLTARAGFLKFYPDLSEETLETLVNEYRRQFDELVSKVPPARFPGVEELLDELDRKNIIMTIATARNRKSLTDFLTKWGMLERFQLILCGEDTKRLKPFPDPVLKTLEELDIRPENALVIGDMPVDIEMGKSAGAYTCGVTYGNSDRESLKKAGADFVVDSLEEFLPLLAGLSKT